MFGLFNLTLSKPVCMLEFFGRIRLWRWRYFFIAEAAGFNRPGSFGYYFCAYNFFMTYRHNVNMLSEM